jgi:putative peptide zinc metalloprotease protein
MTTLADDRSGPAGRPVADPSPADAPARAEGVRLLGEQPGSGYRVPPALVQRADGQVLQLTPLLYAVLAAVDGTRSEEQVAEAVSQAVGRHVVADDVRTLIDGKLRPLGLLRLADGSEPSVRKSNPLLALRFRYVVSQPERTRRLTAPFAVLFHPVAVLAVTLGFAAVVYWVLFDKGLASAAHQAFTRPAMLLAVFAITVVSAGFHEFGHAAALRRGGGTPGAMGAGLYLAYPAFYTDVTDAYRLGRGARLRTDLGGLYFNAIAALVTFGVWALVRWDGLLLIIATQILQMLRQLPPLLRYDGYHILADVTGVPDLFHRIKPTLVGLWPGRWRDREASALKPWARAVVTVWVLAVVPLLLLTVLVTVLTLPRILASAWHSLTTQSSLLHDRWIAGDWLGVGAKVLAMVAVALPVLGVGYLVGRALRQLVQATLARTQGKPARRGLAALVAAAVVAGLTWAWWPHGNYRPIEANERGVLQQALAPVGLHQAVPVAAATHGAGYRTLTEGVRLTAHTVWAKDAPRPTAGHEQLAMVLVPRNPSEPTWVFPFNRPAPPGPGDNQAMAVATKDGSTVYDVAFALVTATSNTVLNKNEAYAFASCTGCTAVAVSFQVVLIVGDAQVIAPQNVSASVSYNCLRCVTAALAIQLDVTVPSKPDAGTAARLAALWAQIRKFSAHLNGLTLAQIRDRLTNYEQQILAIVKPFAHSGSTASTTTSPAVPSSAPVSSVAGTSPAASSSGTSSPPAAPAPATGGAGTGPSTSDTTSAPPTTSAPASAPPTAPATP